MFFWCSETNETDVQDHLQVCPTPNKRSEDEQTDVFEVCILDPNVGS